MLQSPCGNHNNRLQTPLYFTGEPSGTDLDTSTLGNDDQGDGGFLGNFGKWWKKNKDIFDDAGDVIDIITGTSDEKPTPVPGGGGYGDDSPNAKPPWGWIIAGSVFFLGFVVLLLRNKNKNKS